MANALVPQGVLIRLVSSIVFTNFPNLNVTASYLGRQGIGLRFDDVATTPIKTMTGLVQSPEPYQMAVADVHLLKTQALADAFKQQIESNTLLGDATIRPDETTGVGPYSLSNCSINTVEALRFDGTDAGWSIMISGIYYINSSYYTS